MIPTTNIFKINTSKLILFSTICSCFMYILLFIDKSEANIVEENKCKPKSFGKPYVVVRETKNGPDLIHQEHSGLLDLRDTVRSFLCMNGAVILYKSFEFHDSSQGKAHKSIPGGAKNETNNTNVPKPETEGSDPGGSSINVTAPEASNEGGKSGNTSEPNETENMGDSTKNVVEASDKGNSTNASDSETQKIGENKTSDSKPVENEEKLGNISSTPNENGTAIDTGGSNDIINEETAGSSKNITSPKRQALEVKTKISKSSFSKHKTFRQRRKHYKREVKQPEVEGGKTIRFTNATFKVFSHTCLPVNWLPPGNNASNSSDEDDATTSLVGAYQMAGVFLVVPQEPPRFDPAEEVAPKKEQNDTEAKAKNATEVIDSTVNDTSTATKQEIKDNATAADLDNSTSASNGTETNSKSTNLNDTVVDTAATNNSDTNIYQDPLSGDNTTGDQIANKLKRQTQDAVKSDNATSDAAPPSPEADADIAANATQEDSVASNDTSLISDSKAQALSGDGNGTTGDTESTSNSVNNYTSQPSPNVDTPDEEGDENKKKKEPDRVLLFLNHKELGYKIGKEEDVIMDASFVISGPGALCMRVLSLENHTIYFQTMAQSEEEICRWVPNKWERKTENYKRFFRRSLPMSDYEWIECPQLKAKRSGGGSGNSLNIEIPVHKPFAKYRDSDEAAATGRHHHHKKKLRPGPGNNATEEEDEPSDEVFEEPVEPPPEQKKKEKKGKGRGKVKNKEPPGPKIYKYYIELGDCIRLPKYNGKLPCCKFMNAKIAKGNAAVKQCPKLSAALGLVYSEEDQENDEEKKAKAEAGKDVANNTNTGKGKDEGVNKTPTESGKDSDKSNSTDANDAKEKDEADTAKTEAGNEAKGDTRRRWEPDNETDSTNSDAADKSSTGTGNTSPSDESESGKSKSGTQSDKKKDSEKSNKKDDKDANSSSQSESEGEEDESSFIPGTLNDIPMLQWKHELLLLIAEVFVKICVPIKAESVYQLVTTISNILMNAHSPDPREGKYSHLVQKTNMWDIITVSFRRCSAFHTTKQMDWDLTSDLNSENEKPQQSGPPFPGRKKREIKEQSDSIMKLQNSFDDLSKLNGFNLKGYGAGAATDEDAESIEGENDVEFEDTEENKLIIQRSPSVFDFNDDNDATNEFLHLPIPRWEFEDTFGLVPRWRRTPQEENENDKGVTGDSAAEAAGGEGKNENDKGVNEDSAAEAAGGEGKNETLGEGAQSNNGTRVGGDAAADSVQENSEDGNDKNVKQQGEEDDSEIRKFEPPKIPLPSIQEYVPPMKIAVVQHEPDVEPEGNTKHILRHEDFMVFPEKQTIRFSANSTKQIFFYEDFASVVYTLNPVIDAFWKIMCTSLAYCQKYQKGRISSMYPLAYALLEQYFMTPLKDEWINPKVPQEMSMVMGEFGDEDRIMWLNTCMETAYIEGQMLHLRSPRPLFLEDIESGDKANVQAKRMRTNEFIDKPENHGGIFFVKEPKMPKPKKQVGNGNQNNRSKSSAGRKFLN